MGDIAPKVMCLGCGGFATAVVVEGEPEPKPDECPSCGETTFTSVEADSSTGTGV